jgi:hypothetical protein
VRGMSCIRTEDGDGCPGHFTRAGPGFQTRRAAGRLAAWARHAPLPDVPGRRNRPHHPDRGRHLRRGARASRSPSAARP